jgi:hypothetical protein
LLWPRAISAGDGRGIRSRDWSLTGALRVASLIARENADRLYAL